MSSTAENIRAWFLTCPTVAKILKFGTDYIGDEATECSIYSMPSSLNYTEDIMGNIVYSGKQALNFMFALRAHYGDDTEQNIENLKFFEELREWVYQQNKIGNLPEIYEGQVKSIMAGKTQYLASATADTAMYQMQFTVIYWGN